MIPPGQEGKIKLQVNGNKVHGVFRKSATVYSNDPEHPQIRLTLQGKEIPYVEVTPQDRVYLQAYYGEKAEQVLTLHSNEKDLDFQVTGVTSNIDDKITYRYEPGENGTWKLYVFKNPRLPTGNIFGTLFVHTNSQRAKTKSIQVQVMTKGTITVQPAFVNFGRVKFATAGAEPGPVTRNVMLLKTRGDFRVESIEIDNPNFRADLKTVTPGRHYEVAVSFTPPRRQQANQREIGTMTIRTDDPTEPVVTVRLMARSL